LLNEYGGRKTGKARRMKDLEKENFRLRRTISEVRLDKLILQEAARGSLLALLGAGGALTIRVRCWTCLSDG
jgi:hypothetical protein